MFCGKLKNSFVSWLGASPALPQPVSVPQVVPMGSRVWESRAARRPARNGRPCSRIVLSTARPHFVRLNWRKGIQRLEEAQRQSGDLLWLKGLQRVRDEAAECPFFLWRGGADIEPLQIEGRPLDGRLVRCSGGGWRLRGGRGSVVLGIGSKRGTNAKQAHNPHKLHTKPLTQVDTAVKGPAHL